MHTRLNDPVTGAFVLIAQRIHADDLIGHVLRADGRWTYLCLPMEYDQAHPTRWVRDPRKEQGELLWPDRVPRDVLEHLKSALGLYAAAAQLQQLPSPREGGIFKRHWFPRVHVLPGDCTFCRGWDLAATEAKVIKSDPDYTATVLMAWSRSTRTWYVVEAERVREEYHAVRRMIIDRAKSDAESGRFVRLRLPQDPGQAGKGQAKDLMAEVAQYAASAAPVTGDKMQRALPLAGQAGIGNVRILEGAWPIDDFLDELGAFPTGSHDDQVDAASSAFAGLTEGNFGMFEVLAAEMAERERAQQLGAGTPTGRDITDLFRAFTPNLKPPGG